MKVGIYWTDESGVDGDVFSQAEDSLNDLADQLNTTEPINVSLERHVPGDWENVETYDEYLEEFNNQVDFENGETGVLLYFRALYDGFSFSDKAAAGKASTVGGASRYNPEYCVVNTAMANYDNTTYRNFVKHEWLHLHGAEHEDGAQFLRAYGYANSPMVTGYAENIRGGNQLPSTVCNLDDPVETAFHTEEISDCADVSEAIDSNY